MTITAYKAKISQKAIDVVEAGHAPRRGRIAFDLGRDLEFSTEALRSYAFALWEPVIYDAMVVAAAIEFSDRITKRPSRGWARRIDLRIPVHDPDRWSDPAVANSLHDALGFLTGDFWRIEFVQRSETVPPPMQECLPFPARPRLSSLTATAWIRGRWRELRARLVARNWCALRSARNLPENLSSTASCSHSRASPTNLGNGWRTARRARGAGVSSSPLISGLAAYLADAGEILIPESGQGAIGPALVTVSHAYPDYRNHPLFTTRMACFLKALLGKDLRFSFPRLWHTKGETLREFAPLPDGDSWRHTKSCWRNSRWSALNGTLIQCGVCAACMLRRMSVHAAGLSEEPGTYVCTDLSARSLDEAIHPDFKRKSPAFEQYAIAGALHLDHMADMASTDARSSVRRHAVLTGMALGISGSKTEASLVSMFERHAAEWNSFVNDLGSSSFIRQWTRASQ